MFKKIKQAVLAAVTVLLIAAPVLAPVAVYADPPTAPDTGAAGTPATTKSDINGSLCKGVNAATGAADTASCTATTDANGPIAKVISIIINIFSLVVGAVAVIMIIYAGFKYITSGGNDSNVGSAKNTILYAVIGLVVVAVAQLLVRFVLSKANF